MPGVDPGSLELELLEKLLRAGVDESHAGSPLFFAGGAAPVGDGEGSALVDEVAVVGALAVGRELPQLPEGPGIPHADEAVLRVQVVLGGEEDGPIAGEGAVPVEGPLLGGADGPEHRARTEVQLAAAGPLLLEHDRAPGCARIEGEAVAEEVHVDASGARAVEVEEAEDEGHLAGIRVHEPARTDDRPFSARRGAAAAADGDAHHGGRSADEQGASRESRLPRGRAGIVVRPAHRPAHALLQAYHARKGFEPASAALGYHRAR